MKTEATADSLLFVGAEKEPLLVAHVGLMGEQPGGMAQVVNEYLTWSSDEITQIGVLSSRRRRDWAAPLLSLGAALRLIGLARRSSASKVSAVAVFHVSEGGSFVREGGLLLWARALGLRTIAHIHGAAFDDFATNRPALVEFVLARATAIAVLTTITEATVRNLAIDAGPIEVVRNIVPPARALARKERTVLFGGELSERKGVDTLLDAWAQIAPVFPEWQLVLAGPVASGFALPKTLPARVQLLGSLSHATLLDELVRAAVAVLPSRQEALPMFLLEALAHRCATVGSTVGQVPALLGNGVGALVPPADANALASVLAGLLGDPLERERIAARGLAYVEQHYSRDAARAELEAFWRRASAL